MPSAARRYLVAVAAGCALAASPIAWDRADAISSCTISTTAVAFGTYNVYASTANSSTGSVTVRCNGGGTVTITLSSGSAPTFAPRTAKNGTNALNYNLYLDAAHTLVWGDGTGGSVVFSGVVVKNVSQTVTVFAQAPASQDVAVGSYSDSITATIRF